jgi:hypothetical protein
VLVWVAPAASTSGTQQPNAAKRRQSVGMPAAEATRRRSMCSTVWDPLQGGKQPNTDVPSVAPQQTQR